MEGSLSAAMKAVGQAIRLDGAGDSREAYYRYLACIKYISQTVLEDSKEQGYQGPIKTKCTARMLKLAQQCMDRVSAIMENTEEGDASHLTPPPVDQSGRFSPSIRSMNASPLPPEQPAKPYEPPPAIGSVPKPREVPSTGTGPVVAPSASLPIPVGYMRPQTARKDKLTPLEAAYVENQRLMNAYKTRLAQMMETNTRKGQMNKTTLNLTLQRRLMENMAIARAREAALAKKIQERHQRLQEEAARRFSTTGEPTRAEMELRQMYASVMEFESNERWLVEWRRKLRDSPRDLQFIHALIGHILACPAHPFTQLLKKFQFTVYQTLMPLVQKDAETLEQIKVPYKTVEPLKLAGSERKVIPPHGFANPGDLMDKSLDEDLMRRLQALRNSSDEERRESLYGDMLASSSSLDEDEEDDLWDELNDGENSLEDGVGEGNEDDREGGDSTSIKSQVSIEVELHDDRDDSQVSRHGNGDGNNDEANVQDAAVNSQEHPVDESGDRSEGENGKSQEEEEAQILAEVMKEEEELGDDEGEDVVKQMRRISAEVKEDLQEALAEGEELRVALEKQIEQEIVEGTTPRQNGEDDSEETADKSQDGPDRNSDDGEEDELSIPSCEGGDRENEEEPKETESNGNRSDSEINTEQRTVGDSEPTQVSAADRDDTSKDNTPDNSTSEDVSKEDERSQGEEEQKQEVRKAKETSKEEEEQKRIDKLQEDALQRHLKHISKDIQSYLDRLQSLLVAIYEELDSAVAKEQCIAVIEKHFFPVIWQPLLTLFRRANLRREISAATAMTKYQHALPENIGIIKKLCLVSEDDGALQADDRYPYQLAVEELKRISGYFSPLEKLECVVKASRAIITCVGDYYEALGRSRENTENTVGCDDLLPILSFVVIKSALPHIVSECSIMEEFIHEGYLFGEEGYCLTTLQTSLGYVLKLAED